MQLRTLVGAHAGEVREYTYLAAQAALRDGTAEHASVEPATAPAPIVTAPSISQSRKSKATERVQ